MQISVLQERKEDDDERRLVLWINAEIYSRKSRYPAYLFLRRMNIVYR